MAPQIISIVILILLSSCFSATETAFTSLNKIKMKNMAADDVKNADLVLRLSDNYDKLLTTILIGNNIANIGTTAIATVLFVKIFGNMGATISTVVITVLVLIFGEISPKNIAKEHPEGFALAMARPVSVLVVLLTPLNWLFAQWKKLLGKIFGDSEGPAYTEDELITIIDDAGESGSIGEEQSVMIKNAIEFDDLEAIDVITPRVDMVAIELGTENREIAEIFKDTGLSRLPVYEDDLDNIIGVLNQKDFHNYVVAEGRPLEEFIKPVAYVAESIKAAVLLKKMQAKKTHIAIIVDEYGGTTGLVTMEDIIEELVGKIYDEHDTVEMRDVTRIYDGSYMVAGGANLEKFFELFGEDIDEPATTINGWVMIQMDRLPRAGDTFRYESKHKIFSVRVTKADSRRALMTHITVEDRPEEEDQ